MASEGRSGTRSPPNPDCRTSEIGDSQTFGSELVRVSSGQGRSYRSPFQERTDTGVGRLIQGSQVKESVVGEVSCHDLSRVLADEERAPQPQ